MSDSGAGIPAEILAKLGEKGASYGKPRGSGLGLYHARTNVEGWGGRFKIESSAGHGTRVEISLPASRIPDWFVGHIAIEEGTQVVILDDDASIHRIWDDRFRGFLAASRVKTHHFFSPVQLRRFLSENGSIGEGALYLLDHELQGSSDTGLSLAEELSIEARSVLVTSRYGDPAILAECGRLGIKLIPKGMASLVPVTSAEARSPLGDYPDLILLDDDDLVRRLWKVSIEKAGCRLWSFQDVDGLLAQLDGIGKATPLYIDENLGGGISGLKVARDLWQRGFRQLYLTTGYPADRFAPRIL